jgi:hypothetical protein
MWTICSSCHQRYISKTIILSNHPVCKGQNLRKITTLVIELYIGSNSKVKQGNDYYITYILTQFLAFRK